MHTPGIDVNRRATLHAMMAMAAAPTYVSGMAASAISKSPLWQGCGGQRL